MSCLKLVSDDGSIAAPVGTGKVTLSAWPSPMKLGTTPPVTVPRSTSVVPVPGSVLVLPPAVASNVQVPRVNVTLTSPVPSVPSTW